MYSDRFSRDFAQLWKKFEKNCKKIILFSFFTLKLNFTDEKIFSKFKLVSCLIDMIQILSMKPSESKISLSVQSYDEKLLKVREITKIDT